MKRRKLKGESILGTIPPAPKTHFGFCPFCEKEYEMQNGECSFRCFGCDRFMTIAKYFPKEIKKNPSCRWFE